MIPMLQNPPLQSGYYLKLRAYYESFTDNIIIHVPPLNTLWAYRLTPGFALYKGDRVACPGSGHRAKWLTNIRGTISWAAETAENFMPPLSASGTRTIMCSLSVFFGDDVLGTIILLILVMAWGFRTAEFSVTNKSCLSTYASDTQREHKISHRFSSQEIPLNRKTSAVHRRTVLLWGH